MTGEEKPQRPKHELIFPFQPIPSNLQQISKMKFVNFASRTVILTVFLFCGLHAFCWGVTGHRVIGQIAQAHLTKKAKREIGKLLGHESLAWWANWGDNIKSDSSWDFAEHWHYVDLPGHMPKDSFLAALKLLPGKTLYTQLRDLRPELTNRSLSTEQRRQALYWIIHLMGDLHQPLHVGRHADEGGNKIVIYWFGQKTNLHTLWDSKLVDSQQFSYTEYANELQNLEEQDISQIQAGTLDDWFNESHELSDLIYDNSPAESKQGYEYNYQFKKIVDQQLLKGGLRLAMVLNEAFR